MSEIIAGECSHDCARHSRALKRRTISGATLVTTIGLQFVPWESATTHAHVIDPSLHGAAAVTGAVFAVDLAIAGAGRLRKWFRGRIIVLDFSSRDRRPDKE